MSMSRAKTSAQVMVVGHVCLDVIPAIPAGYALKPGALIHVGPATVSTGGLVANTGLALHRLGVSVKLLAHVGDDLFGDAIRRLIRRHGADDVSFVTDAQGATSYTVVINPPGIDRCFLHCPGVNDHFDVQSINDETLRGLRWLHFGYPPLMRHVYTDGGQALAQWFRRAKKLGLTTSLDMCAPDPNAESGHVDWRAFLHNVLPQVDLFAPSLDELATMMGCTVDPQDLDAVSDLAQRVLAMGPAMLCLKLGEFGLWATASSSRQRLEHFGAAAPDDLSSWRGRSCWAPCFQVDVAGTTGAGDTTVAGLIAAVLDGQSLAQAMTFAVAVGACCVQMPDAVSGIPHADEVRRRITAGWPRHEHPQPPTSWRYDPASGNWSTDTH
ncbi:MAG: carbohydrate kinase family protein [Phycisphaeraceae bacterium]|nr:carbohydrate kinase family protein [Phycisphaeraceae bacterium]